MRIGLIVGLHAEDSGSSAPTWAEIEDQVRAAERAGFDLVVFEDAMYFQDQGMWESMAMAGAMSAVTSTIGISHSVVNAPLRHPVLTAKAAETLDEISGGRYILGIGAGNTPGDYATMSIPADPRYSRFAETVEIIHSLLKTGEVDFSGEYYTASSTSLYPRGPRSTGPEIVIAASGPKMLRLCARYGDGWNWFSAATRSADNSRSLMARLEDACEATGREPDTITKTLDIYSLDILGVTDDDRPEFVLAGAPEVLAEHILSYASVGIDEIRVDAVAPAGHRAEAADALTSVVDMVHAV